MYPNTVILYTQNGRLRFISPCVDCGLSLQEIARKDVPFGCGYRFFDSNSIPATTEFFEAWTADFSNPDGYGIGAQRWFIERAEKEIADGINVDENIALIERMKAEVFQIEGVRL